MRYSPGSMKNETEGARLTPAKAFNLDRTSENYNFETGLTSTIGLIIA